jgi:hypothetical protein
MHRTRDFIRQNVERAPQIQGDGTILSRRSAIFLAKHAGAGKHESSAKVCPQRLDDLFVSSWIMERPFRRRLIARLRRYRKKRRKPIFQLLRKERFEFVPAGDHDNSRHNPAQAHRTDAKSVHRERR